LRRINRSHPARRTRRRLYLSSPGGFRSMSSVTSAV
jgi:hypothetical protein